MVSINISIKKEAYDFLEKFKTKDKSFSDVILSFKKEQNNIMEFFGVLKNSDWDKKEKNMKNLRDSFNRKLQ
ncbi:antitoxin VapB family protein [Candidatus Woesearchaeota archaeon]|nr:antitoxin VapB family protein [Candidatus Woesearchaeota archaeon]